MVTHEQHSTKDKLWFDLDAQEVGGTLTIPAGQVWVDGISYDVPALSESVGTAPYRVFIEKDGTGAQYVLDVTMRGMPVSFRVLGGGGQMAPMVVWRTREGGPSHRLLTTG